MLRFERSLLFFLIRQRTAVCQSLGDTENRNKAVKSDAIVGAIMIRIGEMIAFEMPSRPSAQFFRSSNPEDLKNSLFDIAISTKTF